MEESEWEKAPESEAEALYLHRRLVWHIAKRYSKYLETMEYADLLQWGYLGLLMAFRRFRGDKGCKFSTYAYPYINGYMVYALRQDNRGVIRLPQHIKRRAIPVFQLEALWDKRDPEAEFEASLLKQIAVKEDVSSYLEWLKPREREIIVLRYGLDGGQLRTLEEVARYVNITRERVQQVEITALDNIRRHLKLPTEKDKAKNRQWERRWLGR